MKHTPGEALRTTFDATVFSFEIIAVFLLVFFVLAFKLIAIALKKDHNKLFLSTCLVFATALAFFLPYALASIGSKTSISVFLNPLIVFFRSVFIGFGKSGQASNNLTGSILLTGVPYILAAQLIGGILGFTAFSLFFYAFKKTNQHKIEYQFLNKITLRSFFNSTSELSMLGFSIKEFVFISALVIIMPFISSIDLGIYRFDQFGIILIELFVIWIILLFSSFFEYFSFHLFFPSLEIIFKTITFISLDKQLKQQESKNYLNQLFRFVIVLVFSIFIPMIIAFISILIKIQTGAVISVA
ncbi:MAG4940 family membrane protein [Mycoplasma putrefaciens]|nr:hypothetical protein [Mycoplasma putrefaciens]